MQVPRSEISRMVLSAYHPVVGPSTLISSSSLEISHFQGCLYWFAKTIIAGDVAGGLGWWVSLLEAGQGWIVWKALSLAGGPLSPPSHVCIILPSIPGSLLFWLHSGGGGHLS